MRKDEPLTKSYKRVSFMDNQMRELLDALGKCPTISTLLLQRNKMLEEIPEQFLLAFMSLRILDLNKCSNLETLPPVGGLAKLQVLVCSETKITSLPQEVEQPDFLLVVISSRRLRFLSEQRIAFPQLEEVVVEKCPLLKKLPLTVHNVGTIKKIEGERKWWDELEWDNEDIKKLYSPVLRLH
ncbi:hypothetical protein Salat_2869800 [Sesamum alatum]|uniref:Disease resistance protein n=1 Tax=Sesamum alatum TaxID=300844 RepID=A0AAE1XNG5_9LAMI|nr:hypothetical protein Salat_2869800 [Sesamum alatum]